MLGVAGRTGKARSSAFPLGAGRPWQRRGLLGPPEPDPDAEHQRADAGFHTVSPFGRVKPYCLYFLGTVQRHQGPSHTPEPAVAQPRLRLRRRLPAVAV